MLARRLSGRGAVAIGLALVAPLLCGAGGANADTRGTVCLKGRATVEGSQVVLADVAEVRCAEARLAADLGAVYLGPATEGPERRITQGVVKLSLRRAGIKPEEWLFEGAPEVLVRRAPGRPLLPRGTGGDRPVAPAQEKQRPALSRGDLVTVVVRCGAATISGEGEALGPADLGGEAKVRLILTNRLLRGRLEEGRRVVVVVGAGASAQEAGLIP